MRCELAFYCMVKSYAAFYTFATMRAHMYV